jgi:hypothetical protein
MIVYILELSMYYNVYVMYYVAYITADLSLFISY